MRFIEGCARLLVKVMIIDDYCCLLLAFDPSVILI